MRHPLAAAALAVLVVGSSAACAIDGANVGCQQKSCHLKLSEGGSMSLNGQKFSVEHIDAGQVVFGADGFNLVLSKGTDLHIGSFDVHLGDTSGNSANVDVTS